jgi:hypothetical protein
MGLRSDVNAEQAYGVAVPFAMQTAADGFGGSLGGLQLHRGEAKALRVAQKKDFRNRVPERDHPILNAFGLL